MKENINIELSLKTLVLIDQIHGNFSCLAITDNNDLLFICFLAIKHQKSFAKEHACLIADWIIPYLIYSEQFTKMLMLEFLQDISKRVYTKPLIEVLKQSILTQLANRPLDELALL